MILEGVVTTVSSAGEVNIAPMGPTVAADGDLSRFELRPFRTSQTYANLAVGGEGVLHVTDDVLLIARAAVGGLSPDSVPMRPSAVVRGWVLTDACRYAEFRVESRDETGDRVRLSAVAVAGGRLRDFFGLNRAKFAVLELAILATRIHLPGQPDPEAELKRAATLVDKTGGPQEREALAFLTDFLRRAPSPT